MALCCLSKQPPGLLSQGVCVRNIVSFALAPLALHGHGESMTPLLSRVYFNAVYGALGGLLGWLLFGVYGEKNPSRDPAFLPAQVLVKTADGKDKTYLLVGPGEEDAAADRILTYQCHRPGDPRQETGRGRGGQGPGGRQGRTGAAGDCQQLFPDQGTHQLDHRRHAHRRPDRLFRRQRRGDPRSLDGPLRPAGILWRGARDHRRRRRHAHCRVLQLLRRLLSWAAASSSASWPAAWPGASWAWPSA